MVGGGGVWCLWNGDQRPHSLHEGPRWTTDERIPGPGPARRRRGMSVLCAVVPNAVPSEVHSEGPRVARGTGLRLRFTFRGPVPRLRTVERPCGGAPCAVPQAGPCRPLPPRAKAPSCVPQTTGLFRLLLGPKTSTMSQPKLRFPLKTPDCGLNPPALPCGRMLPRGWGGVQGGHGTAALLLGTVRERPLGCVPLRHNPPHPHNRGRRTGGGGGMVW